VYTQAVHKNSPFYTIAPLTEVEIQILNDKVRRRIGCFCQIEVEVVEDEEVKVKKYDPSDLPMF
jgi:adenylate cyclase class IV